MAIFLGFLGATRKGADSELAYERHVITLARRGGEDRFAGEILMRLLGRKMESVSSWATFAGSRFRLKVSTLKARQTTAEASLHERTRVANFWRGATSRPDAQRSFRSGRAAVD